jgi:hypothetical protein
MSAFKRSLVIVVFLVIALFALSACAVAQSPSANVTAVESIDSGNALPGEVAQDDIGKLLDFIVTLGALVPVIAVAAPLISTIVDAAKKAGMAAKYAPAISAALNALVFTLRYFAGNDHAAQFDSAINALYALSPYVLALVLALLATVYSHKQLTAAGLGYSKTPKRA